MEDKILTAKYGLYQNKIITTEYGLYQNSLDKIYYSTKALYRLKPDYTQIMGFLRGANSGTPELF